MKECLECNCMSPLFIIVSPYKINLVPFNRVEDFDQHILENNEKEKYIFIHFCNCYLFFFHAHTQQDYHYGHLYEKEPKMKRVIK